MVFCSTVFAAATVATQGKRPVALRAQHALVQGWARAASTAEEEARARRGGSAAIEQESLAPTIGTAHHVLGELKHVPAPTAAAHSFDSYATMVAGRLPHPQREHVKSRAKSHRSRVNKVSQLLST